MAFNSRYIVNFSQIDKSDLDLVGKKAVELGELTRLGIAIADGFVITTSFFEEFLDLSGISEKIRDVKKLDHPAISESVEKLFDPIKKQIMYTHIPQNLVSELHKFYKKLAGQFKEQSLNIFTSSSSNNKSSTFYTFNEVLDKSIIFKNVKGDANLLLKIKEIWALQLHNPIAIVVQKNINSKNKGKMLTNDPLINDHNLLNLAKKIQKHFYFPQEIDYVIEKDKVYITGIRPFTGIVGRTQKRIQPAKKSRKILIKGISINPGIVTGHVKLINYRNFEDAKSSEIIVTKSLNKSLYNKIKRAKAVVTDAILQTSLDRLYYRKIIKAPTVIATGNATKLLQNGNIITVNGVTGEIYSGGLI